jgi:O-succinylbenzoate synthase
MMRLRSVELFLVELPLVRPFRTSFGTEVSRQAIVVRVVTDEAIGYGECVADKGPYYSAEFNAGAWIVLTELLIPRLLAASELEPEALAGTFGDIKGHRMAKAAVELAVLDAFLREKGVSLQEYLGGTGDRVVPGVSVGISESLDQLEQLVSQYVSTGYRRVKLKIEPGHDIAPVRAIRRLLGEGFALQVDANTAYDRKDAGHLAGLDEFGLLLVEQPLSEEDLLGHAMLAKALSTPICLDESIHSAASARDAIELGACSIVNIKPGRVGGYLQAKAVHDACLERGVPVWCGGMLETGIGRAANLALASLPNFLLPGDISATARYFEEDITAPFILEDGAITVPRGPGIGVEVDEQALSRLSTRRFES